MRRKIEIIMGVLCICGAIYIFDYRNTEQCIASVMLFISGVMSISTNEKFNNILRYTSVGLAIWLFIRIWF